jgi:hypothetical protein
MKAITRKFLAVIVACLPLFCLAQIPVIESFSPSQAWAGEVVTIVGNDLMMVTGASVGSTEGLIIHQDDESLSFMIQPGSQSNTIQLTYNAGQVISTTDLIIMDLDIFATPSHMHTKIDASGGFKVCISADGSTMVSSAPGVVRVYQRSGNSITQETSWNLPGQHGYAIALSSSGNTLAVGAPADNGGRGRLFIYQRTNGVWQEQFAITPATVQPGSGGVNFALAVSISADGNTVAAGVPYDDAEGDGGAFVFTRMGNVWSQVGGELEGTNITGSNPSRQGVTLLLNANGTMLMIFGNDTGSNGAVWIFQNIAGVWSQIQKVIPPADNSIQHFAQPLSGGSLSGRFLFVGAVVSETLPLNGSQEGAVLVYEWNGLQYVFRQRLDSSQGFDFEQFGRTVSSNADGSLVAIGECDPMNPQGRVRVFFNDDINAGNWVEQPIPLRYDPIESDTLDFNPQDGQGKSVALAQNSRWLIIGSPDEQEGFYVYDASAPPIINSFTPEAGTEGTHVIITGENLETVYAASFIDIPATSVALDYLSTTNVRAIVSEGVNAQGNIMLRTKGGEVSVPGFTYVEPPQISSFFPESGLPGTVITIDGLNLQSTHAVLIGGQPATSFQVVNDNQVLATVASGATGPVTLSTSFGESSSGLNFNFLTPAPLITSFDPPSAGPNETILIEGENLFWVDAVHFGSTPALYFSLNEDGNIEAVVGYGSSGDLSVESEGGVNALSGFTYLPPLPEAFAFSPASGPVGTAVTILGNNLEAVSDVDFNGYAAVVIGRNQSSAMALVMPGTSSGPVSVSAGDVQADLPGEFGLTNLLLPNEQQGNINTGVSLLPSTDAASTIVASADGSVVAIGAPEDDTYGLDAGSIRIFSRAADGSYQEIQNLHISSAGASLGSVLTMSADGSMLVANTDISDLDTLNVFLRQPDGQWQLNYKIAGAQEVYSLSLSGDKSKLAVGYRETYYASPMSFSIYELGAGGVLSHQQFVLAGETLGTDRYGKVMFSLDGNTLAIGSYKDNLFRGALWVYRFDQITQTWNSSLKLVPNDAVHANPGDANGARIGWDVAVAANGSRVLVSGMYEGNSTINFLPVNRGAIWSYSFNGVSWVQDGPKIKPQDGVGEIRFGSSIGLSADGNTATVAGYIDNGNIGAIWFLQWNGAAWTQVGNKLVPQGPGTLRTSSLHLTPDARNLFVGSRNSGFYVFQNALTPDYISPSLTLNLGTVSINDSPVVINASSDSPGTITYHVVDGGTAEVSISGNNLSLLSSGFVIIRAVQEASGNYLAGDVYDTLVVEGEINMLAQTIEFLPLPQLLVTDVNYELQGVASSGLPVSFTSSNPSVATVSGNIVTIVGWGETIITAMQEGNAIYLPAMPIQQVLSINRLTQTITFEPLDKKIFSYDDLFELFATSSSGLEIFYTSSDHSVGVIEGNLCTITGAGSSVITATQPGNETYAPTEVQQILLVSQPYIQTINFEGPGSAFVGDTPFQLEGRSTSNLPIIFESSDPSIASIEGDVITIHDEGEIVITASQPGDNYFAPAPNVDRTFIVWPNNVVIGAMRKLGEEEPDPEEIDQLKAHSTFLFPNPTDGLVYLKIPKGSIQEVTGFSALGQKFDVQNFLTDETTLCLDLSKQPAGVYSFRIKEANNNFYTLKVYKR